MTLAAALSVCEIAFRALGYPGAIYEHDPETGLGRLVPENDFNYVKDCLHNRVVTNSAGFHDREFAKTKPAGIYRVAVIGDSFVQALEVPLERAFHEVLEERLATGDVPGGKIQVYAFGRSGNGSALNYLYLKRVVSAYRPDLVIHAFYPLNDPRDDSPALTDKYVRQTGDQEVRSGKVYPRLSDDGVLDAAGLEADLDAQNRARPPRSYLARLARGSSFLMWCKERFKAAVYNAKLLTGAGTDRSAAGIVEMPVDHEVLLKEPGPDWEAAWAVEEKLIEAIAGEARSLGAEYLLVSLPDGFRVEGDYRDQAYWEADKADLKAPEKRLSSIATRGNFRYLNLMPVFTRNSAYSGREKITFSCDGHWNETAHEWAADAIAERLISDATPTEISPL